MSADGVPEPVEMCATDVEEETLEALHVAINRLHATLRDMGRQLMGRQLAAARKALAQSQAQNVRLARMALNVPEDAPTPLLYVARYPSPTRMHSPL